MDRFGKARALDGYLVAAARLGDRAALAQLHAARGPRLLAHAARLLGEPEAARDLVQDAWIEILRGLPGLRDGAAFLPWALAIVTRRVAREIARRQRERGLSAAVAVLAETAAPEPDGAAAAVARALAALGPAQRATVALFYLEGLSLAEVAAATEVPSGTVKSRLMAARDRMRAALQGAQR